MDKSKNSSALTEISGNELIQNLQVGFLVQDKASEILLCNNSALELLGLEKNQLMGKSSFDPSWKVIHEDGSPFPGDTHPVPMAIASLKPVRNVVMGVFHPKKQDFQWILVDAEPHFYQDGTLKHVVCTFIDFSSRKEFEEKSIKKSQFIQNLSKVSFDAIFNWDLINHTIHFSDSYKRLFGCSLKTENTESAVMQRLHPLEVEAFRASLFNAMEGDVNEWVYEYRYLKQNGEYAFVLNRTKFIRDENGNAIKAIGALQDITVQKKEHQRLKLLESVITNTNDAILITDAEPFNESGPIILFVNEAFCRMTGYREDEVIGKTPRMFEGPKSDLETLRKLGESLRKLETCEITIINYKKNGEPFWVHMTINPVADDKGWFTHWISIERDITKEKNAEVALKLSNERYQFVSKATNQAIFDWDILNNEIGWMGDILGTTMGFESHIQKKPSNIKLEDFIHPEDLQRVLKKRMEFLKNPKINLWSDEFRYKSTQGGYLYIYTRGVIIRNEKGWAIRVIGSIEDISKLKENEMRLQELNHSLEAQTKALAVSNEELEQFAYVASHDLQEPLRMVTSFLAQLEKKYGKLIDEKGKTYIEYAVDGAKRMRQIILDLLDYSRVGKIDDAREEIDLNELLKGIQILFRKQIEDKKAIIKISVLPTVNSFRAPLQQVFQNLVGNALKFTKPNVPAIVRIEVEDHNDTWQFIVSDNGIGIEKEDFDKVFIIFKQINSKEEYPGSGIGLAVTKKIIEKQGGKIWVESEYGLGSKFYFTIPK
jgi:PAS domain S-box-containing protein